MIDGDTTVVDVDLGFRLTMQAAVRMAGIDAPEVNAKGPEGETARDWLRARLPVGQAVEMVTEKPADKYGRWLAHVWLVVEGRPEVDSLNAQMLEAGLARPYSGGAR